MCQAGDGEHERAKFEGDAYRTDGKGRCDERLRRTRCSKVECESGGKGEAKVGKVKLRGQESGVKKEGSM